MKKMPIAEAVGTTLAHDVTQVVQGGFKGVVLKKGHVIRAEDLDLLRSIGKENLYVLDLEDGEVHENDAATAVAEVVRGDGVRLTEAHEGKVNVVAQADGLFCTRPEDLLLINRRRGVALVTVPDRTPVRAGQVVAAVKIIPLTIQQAELQQAMQPELFSVKAYMPLTVGIVTTGREVYSGRIKDAFGPVLRRKLAPYGLSILGQEIVPDERERIVAAIRGYLEAGAQLVLVTGGMSVDPDDLSPAAIRAAGAQIESYGAPILPGSMFVLAYAGSVPILGLPACVIHDPLSTFDLVLPRLLTGERVAWDDIAAMGTGGMLGGREVHYPSVVPLD